jgi:hypothetical protein
MIPNQLDQLISTFGDVHLIQDFAPAKTDDGQLTRLIDLKMRNRCHFPYP